jgi:hypothetical protein
MTVHSRARSGANTFDVAASLVVPASAITLGTFPAASIATSPMLS